jgi:pyruvate carboxylase
MMQVREMYAPFECGMKSGTARVYDHEIPGGQYSNLMVQCQSMGIWHKWEQVKDRTEMYATYPRHNRALIESCIVTIVSPELPQR